MSEGLKPGEKELIIEAAVSTGEDAFDRGCSSEEVFESIMEGYPSLNPLEVYKAFTAAEARHLREHGVEE